MKNIRIILISAIMLLSIFLVSAVAQDEFDEFDEFGYNFTARIFNGLLGDVDMDTDSDTYVDRQGEKSPTFPPSGDFHPLEYIGADGEEYEVLIDVAGAQLVGKWSKGLHIGGPDPDEVGTWVTYHIEGNGKIYDAEGGIFYEGHLIIFCKIQKVSEGLELITQLVINGQGVVAKEIPPGFGLHIFKEVED